MRNWLKQLWSSDETSGGPVRIRPSMSMVEMGVAIFSRRLADRIMFLFFKHRYSVHAQVIRSCQHCGAPGFWHDVPNVNLACYDPSRLNQPVGDRCPACGMPRQALEDKGELCYGFTK